MAGGLHCDRAPDLLVNPLDLVSAHQTAELGLAERSRLGLLFRAVRHEDRVVLEVSLGDLLGCEAGLLGRVPRTQDLTGRLEGADQPHVALPLDARSARLPGLDGPAL